VKIILDQDEVLAHWVDKVLLWYNEDFQTSFTRHDVKDYWAMQDILGPAGKHFIRSCMRWPEFYTRLEPVQGAIEGVKELIDAGHEVRIVTAVPVSAGIAYHGKTQWLRDHMPFFDLKDFYAVHKKDEVMGDILLDDGPHNIIDWEKTGRPAVVFDAPWNQGVQSTYRIKNWKEFLELINDIDHIKKLGLLRT
jgi:5'(3')-deoxyribonucleotidase